MDETVFRFFNGFYNVAPPIWPWVGTSAATVVFALLTVGIAFGTRRTRWLLAALVAVTISDVGTSRVLKPMTERARPCATLQHVWGGAQCGSGGSMPSAHAANTMAVASVIGSPSLAFVSVVVGTSRVVGGQHWPMDVLAGWGVGLVVGGAVRWLFEKVFKWG